MIALYMATVYVVQLFLITPMFVRLFSSHQAGKLIKQEYPSNAK